MTDETNATVKVARQTFLRANNHTAMAFAYWQNEVQPLITQERAAERPEAEIGDMVDRAVDAWAREDGSEDERLPGARLRAMLEVDA